MKRRIKKNYIRRGVCPSCKGDGGISMITFTKPYRRLSNACDNCGMTHSIVGRHIESEQTDWHKPIEPTSCDRHPSFKKLFEEIEG